jgi:hypothetical protein
LQVRLNGFDFKIYTPSTISKLRKILLRIVANEYNEYANCVAFFKIFSVPGINC